MASDFIVHVESVPVQNVGVVATTPHVGELTSPAAEQALAVARTAVVEVLGKTTLGPDGWLEVTIKGSVSDKPGVDDSLSISLARVGAPDGHVDSPANPPLRFPAPAVAEKPDEEAKPKKRAAKKRRA